MEPITATVIKLKADTARCEVGFKEGVEIGASFKVYPSNLVMNDGVISVWTDGIKGTKEGYVPIVLLDWFGKEAQIKRFLTVL